MVFSSGCWIRVSFRIVPFSSTWLKVLVRPQGLFGSLESGVFNESAKLWGCKSKKKACAKLAMIIANTTKKKRRVLLHQKWLQNKYQMIQIF